MSAETAGAFNSEVMDEKMEEIDDSFEDLLIFPTRDGLRRSLRMIEIYFAMEREFLSQYTLRNDTKKGLIEEQQSVLDIGRKEINKKGQVGSSTASCCTTN